MPITCPSRHALANFAQPGGTIALFTRYYGVGSGIVGSPADMRASRDAPIKEALISAGKPETLPVPSRFLLEDASLFLDFDGTLVDLIDRPDEVIADAALRTLLTNLDRLLGGKLAVVSGRSLAQLDVILGPVAQIVALSGSHGSEQRWRGISVAPPRPAVLEHAALRLRAFADARPGVLVEEKSYGVALHYRKFPDVEQDALKAARDLASELELYLQDGKMMIELRAPGGDKGLAIRRLMSLPPMQGSRPIFIGDDRTDETGFAVVAELGGFGILVGVPRATAATFGLADPAKVRAWLMEILA